MNTETLRALLQQVATGSCAPEAAIEKLRTLPFTEAAQTLADTHREIRTGLPEVVYGRQKTTQQIMEAVSILHSAHGHALATQVSAESSAALLRHFPQGRYDAVSSLLSLGSMKPRARQDIVSVVCAGTSDLSVAEEAAGTLEYAGAKVHRVHDVGVAGLHRLLGKLEVIRESKVIIAIAGMEGALPGVIAGLVAAPVIAVPTSVGYGASFGGLSALLSMLNACSGGIGVVNIDNGFGAAVLALRILNSSAR
ncbi:MAG: nickel pincer cofactor biosynthesis protein LarB [Verrucomicrobiaceae bacterium]